jgi:hypothetical protein
MRRATLSGVRAMAGMLALATTLLAAPAAHAGFGFAPGSVSAVAENSNGTVDTQAGSHPYQYTLSFAFKTGENGNTEGGEPRDVIVDLPNGMIGNPLAVPRCPRADFEGSGSAQCPVATQIGVLHADIAGAGEIAGPVYNMQAPPGVAGQLAFSGVNFNVLENASVRSEEGYGLRVGTFDIPLETKSVTEVIWGTPADSSHDKERGEAITFPGSPPESSSAPLQPYLSLPTSCAAAPQLTIRADSNLAPGVFDETSVQSVDAGGNPAPLSGCGRVPFAPEVSARPTSEVADSPSGLDFGLGLPDQGLLLPSGNLESQPGKTVVTLPPGITVNPSAASGLGACTPAQYRAESATSAPGQGCPESSKLGTLLVKTPLLEEPLEGSVYLATPHDNPFDSLLALYIVVQAPERGVVVRQAGEVQADPVTGQLTTTFDGLPPLPYSSFQFDLREGPRAPLIAPRTCGTYTTQVKLYPFSSPNVPTERSASFRIGSGPNGGACSSSEAQLPNGPSLQAGTLTPLAGAFSPFVFRVSREDGSQRLGAITASLPEGLLGKLAGVPYCSDAQIASATARSGQGEGASEQSSPSCPGASQLGVANVTAGAGSQPYAVQGNVYLAGPYKNAPLSLAVITPAIAGPFDLGTVVVRVALYVDPNTAQIRAVSDPIPTILYGIPLDIRSVSLNVNRAGFMFNPTSCDATGVGAQAISTLGQVAALSNRFQVGGCSGLQFKPSLTASTLGKASKVDGASLTVKIAAKQGEANIRKVNLQLPVTLPSRLSTLQKACTEAVFNANPASCPAGSVIGNGTAHTPILQAPLTGPAYLVSHGGAAFPDVEFVLQASERGGDIEVILDGNTQIKKGITHSNFETVPDAPISSFEATFPEGPHSILGAFVPASANYSLCGQTLQMPTTLTAQNGALVKQATAITVTGCAPAIMVTSHRVSGRTATLVLRVPSAGRLVASGTGLTAARKSVAKATSVTLKVSLTSSERTFLARHPHRKVKLRVKLRFTPQKGSSLSGAVTVLIG